MAHRLPLEAAGRLREADAAYERAVELSGPSDRDYETFQQNLDRWRETLGRGE